MNRFIKAAAVSAIVAFAATAANAACAPAKVAGASALIRPEAGINQRLIDAAIRAEVNYQRCRAGMRPLAASGGLAKVAATHAGWMARSRNVSHNSTVSGLSSLRSRLKGSGEKFRVGAENIGMTQRFAVEGGPFKIGNAGACEFTTYAGKPLGAHSYASLARHIVTLWSSSKEHRRNMMDRRVSKIGSGAGFTAKAPYCGQFYVSQTFAG